MAAVWNRKRSAPIFEPEPQAEEEEEEYHEDEIPQAIDFYGFASKNRLKMLLKDRKRGPPLGGLSSRSFDGAPSFARRNAGPARDEPLQITNQAMATIQIPDDAEICDSGYSPDVLAICVGPNEKSIEAINRNINDICAMLELNTDETTQVHVTDDIGFESFPYIYEALSNSSIRIGHQDALSVAFYPTHSVWSVGLSRKKGKAAREETAMLGICLQVAPGHRAYAAICKKFPLFKKLCVSVGAPGPVEPTTVPPRRQFEGGAAPWKQQAKAPAPTYEEEEGEEVYDKPLPIELSADEPIGEKLESCEMRGVAVCSGKKLRPIYGYADAAIKHLIGEDEAETIEYIDDPDWENFPEVGHKLKSQGLPENCLTMGICAARGVWAIALAGKTKNRLQAVKGALLAALVYQTESTTGEAIDLREFDTELHKFVESGK